ncbi:hypothetical protein B0A49_01263 [Cryomyces minteri]|uniref:Uncharacterized protein n=1 Tax=Cryomyces minteri TaxID=331657 RepID=A0A4V5NI40_9PEZI|nr:hypothetical protein B0A49_01263 [Cryomyces minteri]
MATSIPFLTSLGGDTATARGHTQVTNIARYREYWQNIQKYEPSNGGTLDLAALNQRNADNAMDQEADLADLRDTIGHITTLMTQGEKGIDVVESLSSEIREKEEDLSPGQSQASAVQSSASPTHVVMPKEGVTRMQDKRYERKVFVRDSTEFVSARELRDFAEDAGEERVSDNPTHTSETLLQAPDEEELEKMRKILDDAEGTAWSIGERDANEAEEARDIAERRLSATKDELESVRKIADDLRQELTQERTETVAKDTEVHTLKTQLEYLRRATEKQLTDLKDANATKASDAWRDATRECDDKWHTMMDGTLVAYSAEKSALQQRIDALDRTNDTLQAQVDAMTTGHGEISAIIEKRLEDLESLNQGLSLSRDDHAAKAADLEEKHRRTKERLNDMRKDKAAVAAALKKVETELETLTEEKMQVVAELAQAQAQLVALQTEYDLMATQAQDRTADLERYLRAAKDALEDQEQHANRLRQENTRLKQQKDDDLAASEKSAEEASKRVQELEDRLATTEQSLDAAGATTRDYDAKLNAAETERQSLAAKLSAAGSEHTALLAAKTDVESKLEQAILELAASEGTVEERDESLRAEEEKSSDLLATKSALERANHDLKNQCARAEQSLRDLKNGETALGAEKTKLLSELEAEREAARNAALKAAQDAEVIKNANEEAERQSKLQLSEQGKKLADQEKTLADQGTKLADQEKKLAVSTAEQLKEMRGTTYLFQQQIISAFMPLLRGIATKDTDKIYTNMGLLLDLTKLQSTGHLIFRKNKGFLSAVHPKKYEFHADTNGIGLLLIRLCCTAGVSSELLATLEYVVDVLPIQHAEDVDKMFMTLYLAVDNSKNMPAEMDMETKTKTLLVSIRCLEFFVRIGLPLQNMHINVGYMLYLRDETATAMAQAGITNGLLSTMLGWLKQAFMDPSRLQGLPTLLSHLPVIGSYDGRFMFADTDTTIVFVDPEKSLVTRYNKAELSSLAGVGFIDRFGIRFSSGRRVPGGTSEIQGDFWTLRDATCNRFIAAHLREIRSNTEHRNDGEKL